MRISDWSSDVCSSDLYVALERETFDRLIDFISTGGYALRAYDRFRRLRQGADGLWHVSHPRFVEQHRMNEGVIVDAPLIEVRSKRGRQIGTLEEGCASTLSPGAPCPVSGLSLECGRTATTDKSRRPTRNKH